jgi:putative transposase
MDEFAASYRGWINEALQKASHHRDRKWTESIAVGSESFVKGTKTLLGADGIGRKVRESEDAFELREHVIPYNGNFGRENVVLSPKNRYRWEGFH